MKVFMVGAIAGLILSAIVAELLVKQLNGELKELNWRKLWAKLKMRL